MFKIDLCQFVFNNASLIRLLKKRGKIIRGGNPQKLDEINKEIQTIKKEPKTQRKFSRPCAAFITFDKIHGAKTVSKYFKEVMKQEKSTKKKSKKDVFRSQNFEEDDDSEEEEAELPTLLGGPIKLKKTCNPSDYLYENMQQPRWVYMKKVFWALTFILISALLVFKMVYSLKKSA
mmetsp:Transcript_19443/g.29889  ORF Transcript_19443/g.29889 Transcript_19443/m.29889 type:complete len:176 (+) Transcript_19443:1414-1941(+)